MTDDEFTIWLDAQSRERIEAALERAKRRDTEWWDDESFEAVLMEEVYALHVADMTRDLHLRGFVDATVTDDGEIAYSLTDMGREAVS